MATRSPGQVAWLILWAMSTLRDTRGVVSEMWGFMKEWLKVASLPDDNELTADLKAVDYGYDASDAILLERKDDMRRRGLASPDDGDALALTFAYPVANRDWAEERRFEEGLQRPKRWVV